MELSCASTSSGTHEHHWFSAVYDDGNNLSHISSLHELTMLITYQLTIFWFFFLSQFFLNIINVNVTSRLLQQCIQIHIFFQVLRKKYYNMVEDMKGKIRVYCRVRPMSSTETKNVSAFLCSLAFAMPTINSAGTQILLLCFCWPDLVIWPEFVTSCIVHLTYLWRRQPSGTTCHIGLLIIVSLGLNIS